MASGKPNNAKHGDGDFGYVIVCEDAHKFVDVFYLVLMHVGQGSHLPEIYEVFGPDVLRFMEIFAGVTFRTPSEQVIADAVRDARIFVLLEENRSTPRVEDLAREYELSPGRVRDIHKKVKELAERIATQVPEVPPSKRKGRK